MIDVEAAIRDALKRQDAATLQGYRALKTKVVVKEKEAGRPAQQPLSEEEMMALIRREVKERREANEFLAPARPEYAVNQEIIALLERHLPAQLSGEEAEAVIHRVLEQVQPQGPREMGKVMAALRQTGAPLDMARASARVKELLQARDG